MSWSGDALPQLGRAARSRMESGSARWDFNGLTHKFVPRLTDIMRIET